MEKEKIKAFTAIIEESLTDQSFIKITLSKPSLKGDLKNIYGRIISLKDTPHFHFTFRYRTRDEVKNFDLESGLQNILLWLKEDFYNADLFTLNKDYAFKKSKKGKISILKSTPSISKKPSSEHNHQKKEWINVKDNCYLQKLGVLTSKGEVAKSSRRKFRQINKYIEIIDSLIKQHPIPKIPRIVDIGSGKGYLTFALYDYLLNTAELLPVMTGIELRPELVELCTQTAHLCHFSGLNFAARNIADFKLEQVDMLIALHACDITTDIAIAKGIQTNASIIIVAPCCQKQIRAEMEDAKNLNPLIRHGIHKEKIAVIITDTIRSLLLEAHGYQTKVFEFISHEHTSKNVMITALKGNKRKDALKEIKNIKAQFGIKQHYLETLLPPNLNGRDN